MAITYLLYVTSAWAVTVNLGPHFINSQTNYTSGTTFNASSIQVQPSHIYFGSKYYDLTTTGGKVAANVTSFYEDQNVTVHILNSSLTNVNMTVSGQATRVKIDGTFYDYGTRWYYINGNSTLINVQSGRDVFVDFVTPTVITSTDPRLESSGEQRASYFDGTNNWIFYYDGSNIVYRYSPNGGTTWSAPASTGSGTLASSSYFGVYGESNKIVITWASTAGVFTKTGTINGTSISWAPSVSVPFGSNNGQNYYPSFEKVSSNLFLAANVVGTGTSGITLNNVQSTSGTLSKKPFQITLSSFNAGTGSNRLLVVGVEANNEFVNSVTFGGVSLTKAVSHFTNNDAEFWYLTNPSGTGNIVVTMNGRTSVVVGAYAFSGVNQTMPLPTTATNFNTVSSNPSISITTQYPNSWVLDLPAIYGGKTLGSPTCTQHWDINIASAITGASSSKTTTSPGSVTCSWTASPSGDIWDDVAVEVKAASITPANEGGVVNSTNLGSSWTSSKTLYSGETYPAIVGIAKYSSTNLIAVFAKYGSGEFNYTTYNGGTGMWSGVSATSGAGLTANQNKTHAFSITSNGTCAWVGYVSSNSGGNPKATTFCGSFSTPTTINTGTALYPSISQVNNDIHLFYVNSTNNVINRIINTGGTWLQNVSPFGTVFTNPSFLHAEKYGYGGNHVPVIWREGTGSPFTIKFGTSIMTVQWENPGYDYQVTTDTYDQSEPAVASKADASALVSGNNDQNGNNCDIFQSTNGGTGWNSKGVLSKVSQSDAFSDPSITLDSSGNFYYTCVEFNPSNNTGIYVVMQESSDGGNTWPNSYVVVTHHTDKVDKPWIAADHVSGSPYKNNVYGCWTELYSNGTNKIFFKRYVVSGSSTIPYDSDSNKVQLDSGAVSGCSIAIGPGGQVYVAWANGGTTGGGTIYLKRNLSGGNPSSWQGPYTVGTWESLPFNANCPSGYECVNGIDGGATPFRVTHFPSIAIDSSGAVHVTWMTYTGPATLTDILYTNSNSCGSGSCQFASPPIQVNLDINTTDQWEPAISVSNSGNIIHITAYDRRDDTNNQFYRPYDYFCSYGTFINCLNQSQWTNTPSSTAGSSNLDLTSDLDDYHSVTTSNIRQAYNVWTDSRNISSNNNYDIYAERTSR